MNKSIYFFILLSVFTIYSVQAQTMIEWKKDVKLNFENFKKKPVQTKVYPPIKQMPKNKIDFFA